MKITLDRHLMFLLSLLAALAASPLRQAEAANDQARVVAEGDEDHSIELTDGGVGDDSDATIRTEPVGSLSPGLIAHARLEAVFPTPLLGQGPVSRIEVDRPPRPPLPLARRLAESQRFRF